MKILSKVLLISIAFCLILSPTAVCAGDREEAINKELDCLEQKIDQDGQLNWGDVCYTYDYREKVIDGELDKVSRQKTASQRYMVQAEPSAEPALLPKAGIIPQPMIRETAEGSTLDDQGVYKKPKPKTKRGLPGNFEMGTELYVFRYREPSINVKSDGYFYGLLGTYTYEIPHGNPIEEFEAPLDFVDMATVFKADGRVTWGSVNYEGSGTHDGIPDYSYELRGTVGLRIPVSEEDASHIVPYVGVGYRYLHDAFDEVPPKTIDGVNYLSGYEREANYIYMPLGLDIKQYLDKGWAWGMNLEYDFFLGGKQISHLEDMQDASGTNAGFDKLENDQGEGFGCRGSLKLMKEKPDYDFFIEPFVRYWRLQDSSTDVSCSGSSCLAGREPKNNSTEYGFKLGVHFK